MGRLWSVEVEIEEDRDEDEDDEREGTCFDGVVLYTPRRKTDIT